MATSMATVLFFIAPLHFFCEIAPFNFCKLSDYKMRKLGGGCDVLGIWCRNMGSGIMAAVYTATTLVFGAHQTGAMGGKKPTNEIYGNRVLLPQIQDPVTSLESHQAN
ncbi:MAG: hypothetical protein R2883_06005 [Caldisericia bacterium]